MQHKIVKKIRKKRKLVVFRYMILIQLEKIILLLFFIIFYRGFTVIATESRYLMNRKFQSMVAQGISVWFLVQALINIGVTIGILPTKGLTLPFISYGGSSILINFIALAILLKIDYENKQIKRGVEVE